MYVMLDQYASSGDFETVFEYNDEITQMFIKYTMYINVQHVDRRRIRRKSNQVNEWPIIQI